jgi:protein transport protein SEC23
VLDVFVASVDQVGVIEMKSCIEMTGGFYIMTSSFGDPVFKESFKKFFEVDENGELKMGFLAQVKVITSEGIKVSGAIGQCAPIKTPSNQFISSTEIGVGQTNNWYLGGIDRNKSLAVYFDITSTQNLKAQKKVFIQFQTSYQHVNG